MARHFFRSRRFCRLFDPRTTFRDVATRLKRLSKMIMADVAAVVQHRIMISVAFLALRTVVAFQIFHSHRFACSHRSKIFHYGLKSDVCLSVLPIYPVHAPTCKRKHRKPKIDEKTAR